ncbi:kelch-like protein 9 [Elysia marginata]|uniref:Kelch-like protein 9 n=1 Tax=Elysia marginata TaxID=1093978 RepID=A0AAV4J5E7_9GAST|nr:kelch-like protein 9 [Elysia marginata]
MASSFFSTPPDTGRHPKPPRSSFSMDSYIPGNKQTPPAPPTGQQMFEFLLLFDKSSGSPKVNYFMVDPFAPSRIFPKMNTIAIHKIKNISGYQPVVLNNCLYLIGGKDWNNGTYMSGVWKFDPRLNSWSIGRPMTHARCRFTTEVLNGYLYAMGGETQGCKVTDSVERYDPLADRWIQVCPLPKPRADHASCVQGGKIFVSGGISNLKHQCSNVFW